ncbi:MAG: alkaline phosphatase family protein [Bacteroidia bacterium]|nr:alkaline phosphatase family protein [Bacteroidia bacterium]
MKRREFLKKAGLTAAGVVAAPYILPSGRLFAATGSRIANHVVLCLFAGGVRNWESVGKAEGNLMPNLLNGNESISPDIQFGMDPLPAKPLSSPLQNLGTLYKEFRYNEGPAGHYAAHSVALTGRYADTAINLNRPPEYPTIFELYRKHTSPTQSPLNAWWVSNSLGPYPYLHYSTYPGYGSLYGANYIQPTSLISLSGYNVLGNMRQFTSSQNTSVEELRNFLDKNFSGSYDVNSGGITNAAGEYVTVRNFLRDLLANAAAGQYNNPWGAGASMNNDMYNIFFAEEIIKKFQPELTVVNMQDVDVCHFEFTSYCNNLRKADHAVARLWNTIQSTPGMQNDTILIVVPEHGRNAQSNTIIDAFGRYAVDHTAIDGGGDQTSREIFCLVAGPGNLVNQGTVVTQQIGESIDVAPTVARILGFDSDIPSEVSLPGQHLAGAFK